MRDEARVLEDAQVLGDRRPAHGQLRRELADRPRPPAQQLEDLPPRRIAERVERMTVSLHLP
jgi:hypothetical protein